MCSARRELFDESIVIYNNTVVPKPTCRGASSRWIFVIKKITKSTITYTYTSHTHTYIHALTVVRDTIVYDRKL